LRARGEYEKALFEYNHAVRLAPGVARYYADRGRNHLAKSDLVWARADLDEAIKLDPADPRARLARGVLNFADGKFNAAGEDFAAALARSPGDAETRLWLHAVRAHTRVEDPAMLARALDELGPDACDRAFFAGEIAALSGRDAALSFRQAAEACAPDRFARTGALAEIKRAGG
jgi:tetratricopeptide (TPR) repeat protein